MEKKDIRLNESQISKMKHAIGYSICKVNNGRYTFFRNRYMCGKDKDWEELCSLGFAKKRKDPFCDDDYMYWVSNAGLSYLAKLLGIEIIED